MKFLAVTLLATAAATASAAPCPVADMLEYAKTPVVKACEAVGGSSLTAIAATGKLPDDNVLKAVCGNNDCKTAISGLSKFVPCSLLSGAPLGDLLNQYTTKCSSIGFPNAAKGINPVAPNPAGYQPNNSNYRAVDNWNSRQRDGQSYNNDGRPNSNNYSNRTFPITFMPDQNSASTIATASCAVIAAVVATLF